MSTCPSNDIHSIYLDNELPASYVAEYEAHVKTCESCAQKITAFRALHDALKTEALATTPDSHYLAQSWERLQVRKSYSRVTKHVHEYPQNRLKYAAAVAAAVLLGILIPTKFLHTSAAMQTQTSLTPISRNSSVALSKDNIVINGNLEQLDVFAPPFSSNEHSHAFVKYNGAFPTHMSARSAAERTRGDFDVFRPDFDDGYAITIKISVPGIVAPPLLANVDMPTAQFSSAIK